MRMFELAGRPERPPGVKRGRALFEASGERRAEPVARPGQAVAGSTGALRVRGLGVELGGPGAGRRRVLDGIDLDLRPGEIVALVGPNGAGKSTLLRTLAGVLEPAEGRVQTAAGCALLTQRPDDYFVRERVERGAPRRGRGGWRWRRRASTSTPRGIPAISPAASASDWRWRSRWPAAVPAARRRG